MAPHLVGAGVAAALAVLLPCGVVGTGYSVMKPKIHQPMSEWALRQAGLTDTGSTSRSLMPGMVSFKALEAGVLWNDTPDERVLDGHADQSVLDNFARYKIGTAVRKKPLRGRHHRDQRVLRRDVLELRSGARVLQETVDMRKESLVQRMHFYDLQVCHAKPPCNLINVSYEDETYMTNVCGKVSNVEVRDLIVSQAATWFMRGCVNTHNVWNAKREIEKLTPQAMVRQTVMLRSQVATEDKIGFLKAMEEYDLARANDRLPKPRAPLRDELDKARGINGEFFLGNIFHMIEDSFSASHAARRAGPSGRPQEGDIIYFQDTASQDSERHQIADKPMCTADFRRYAKCSRGLEGLAWDPKGILPALGSMGGCFGTEKNLEMLQFCVKTMTGVEPLPKSRPRIKGWARAVEILGGHIRGETCGSVPAHHIWAGAPGAIGAAIAAERIATIYRVSAHDTIVPHNHFAAMRETCVKGARALAAYLEEDVLPLENPHTRAGGSSRSFTTPQCPAATTTVKNFARYSDWDRSLQSRIGRFFDDIKSNVRTTVGTAVSKHIRTAEKAMRETIRSLTSSAAASFPKKVSETTLAHLPYPDAELTCATKCRPFGGGKLLNPSNAPATERYGTACLRKTFAGGQIVWSYGCCVDLPRRIGSKVPERTPLGERKFFDMIRKPYWTFNRKGDQTERNPETPLADLDTVADVTDDEVGEGNSASSASSSASEEEEQEQEERVNAEREVEEQVAQVEAEQQVGEEGGGDTGKQDQQQPQEEDPTRSEKRVQE